MARASGKKQDLATLEENDWLIGFHVDIGFIGPLLSRILQTASQFREILFIEINEANCFMYNKQTQF